MPGPDRSQTIHKVVHCRISRHSGITEPDFVRERLVTEHHRELSAGFADEIWHIQVTLSRRRIRTEQNVLVRCDPFDNLFRDNLYCFGAHGSFCRPHTVRAASKNGFVQFDGAPYLVSRVLRSDEWRDRKVPVRKPGFRRIRRAHQRQDRMVKRSRSQFSPFLFRRVAVSGENRRDNVPLKSEHLELLLIGIPLPLSDQIHKEGEFCARTVTKPGEIEPYDKISKISI
ncbi:MAG: hypothetical protein BWY06_01225 [Candidatus Latescibacteria bacterium ADurb.Bin168]|nr:MAG: hypothetical protein BWY06_01225 [Candidatus Latescibacteria bacterium ADurb.Bin168]